MADPTDPAVRLDIDDPDRPLDRLTAVDIKRQAHQAGWLYLAVAITAPLGILIVPGQMIVAGDAAATAARIAASDWLLRLGIVSELLHQAIQIFLLLALFRLFRATSEGLTAQMVILGALVSVPIVFVNVLSEIAASLIANGAVSFDKGTADALTYLFMQLHGQGIIVAQVFWGLWLFPFGLLVIRCGFIPRFLGYLLLVAGAAYLVDSAVTLLLPQYAAPIKPITNVLAICEVPIVFWLLIWGARIPVADQSRTVG